MVTLPTSGDAARRRLAVGTMHETTTPHDDGMAANRYTLLRRIGIGGMGDVYLARATNEAGIARYVVLKRLLAERSADPSFVSMFLGEAILASQLQHPNITQVFDIGTLGDSYFFTMEYVDGEKLSDVLTRLWSEGRWLPVEHVLYIASNTAAALHHAHERVGMDGEPLGIVHRDVSPSNLMINYEGVVKLLDFGVAKARHSDQTRTGTVKGKVGYLSPEQCTGAPVDRRTDIFLLGIVMYEMLTETRLYKRHSDLATMTAIVNEKLAPPSRLRPEISPDLDHIVMTALARDPVHRYVTAGDLIDEIENLAMRDHHRLSAAGMSRFLRELFTERNDTLIDIVLEPEPAADDDRTVEPNDDRTVEAEPLIIVEESSDVDDSQVGRVLAELEHEPVVPPQAQPTWRTARARRVVMLCVLLAGLAAGVFGGIAIDWFPQRSGTTRAAASSIDAGVAAITPP